MRVKISVFVHGFSISLFVASNVRTHVQVMGSRLESGTVLWGILSRARLGSFPAVSQLAHSNDDHHDRRLNAPRPSFSFPEFGHFYHLSLGMTIRHIWMTFVSVLDISGLSNARTAVKIDLSTFLTKF